MVMMLFKSFNRIVKNIAIQNLNNNNSFKKFSSTSSKIKRFYKQVNIVRIESDRYELILDQRKLKTPKGNVFYVPNEPLASMIAAEWDSQKDKIKLDQMHLTTLTNTVIDNPGNLDLESNTEKLLSYLEFDTVCYRQSMPEELLKIQQEKLDPIVQWFADQFKCSMPVTNGVVLPEIDQKTKEILRKYLKSINIWSITGIVHATENLKSLILTLALINRYLSVEEAVKLSRIEENFQTSKWKSVEYHHDIEQFNLETRIAAALLFILLNFEKSSSSVIYHKN